MEKNLRLYFYNYFKGLEMGDTVMILESFAVKRDDPFPAVRRCACKEFYTKLFNDTRQSDIALLNIFEGRDNNYTAAVHFKYHWILKMGHQRILNALTF